MLRSVRGVAGLRRNPHNGVRVYQFIIDGPDEDQHREQCPDGREAYEDDWADAQNPENRESPSSERCSMFMGIGSGSGFVVRYGGSPAEVLIGFRRRFLWRNHSLSRA